jgi:predicted secreted hydrolase
MSRVLSVVVVMTAVCIAAAADPVWREASRDYVIELPRDHASHPDYRVEWWYYTGQLVAVDGRRFGYQVTFFRIGVDQHPSNPSVWAVRDLHMAHAAITDIRVGRHVFAERLNRAGVGWAGAATEEYHVWNEDWSVRRDDRGRHVIRIADSQFDLALALEESPAVLHGEQGYSQKGATPGNASHYYSLTRMATSGTLTVGGAAAAVSGTSWMDHEFGSSFVERSQQGWDWFSIQLDDGTDLMLFQLRRPDGTADPRSSGTMRRKGATRELLASGFTLRAGRVWASPRTEGRYPVTWSIDVPDEQLTLTIDPVIDDQELTLSKSGIAYWEGAVVVAGHSRGRPVAGRGYLEMTGYAGAGMGEVLGRPSPD